MKLIKQANGKQTIKMSQSEWEDVGKKAGWKTAGNGQGPVGDQQVSKEQVQNAMNNIEAPSFSLKALIDLLKSMGGVMEQGRREQNPESGSFDPSNPTPPQL